MKIDNGVIRVRKMGHTVPRAGIERIYLAFRENVLPVTPPSPFDGITQSNLPVYAALALRGLH